MTRAGTQGMNERLGHCQQARPGLLAPAGKLSNFWNFYFDCRISVCLITRFLIRASLLPKSGWEKADYVALLIATIIRSAQMAAVEKATKQKHWRESEDVNAILDHSTMLAKSVRAAADRKHNVSINLAVNAD